MMTKMRDEGPGNAAPKDTTETSRPSDHRKHETGYRHGILASIVGPTGVGKTAVALEIAEPMNAEIVSIDSAQVFRDLDLGTSKPPADQRVRVTHHLIDIIPPDRELTVATFKEMADSAIDDIIVRGRTPLLVGGSGLYYRAVVDGLSFPGTTADSDLRETLTTIAEESPEELHGFLMELDPEAAVEIHPNNVRRITRALEVALRGDRISRRERSWTDFESPYDLIAVGLEMDRASLYEITDRRVDEMVERGLVGEVESLMERGLEDWPNSSQLIGYRQMMDHLQGELSLAEAISEIKKRTRHLVKRQYTWFKKDPRIRWFEVPGTGPTGTSTRSEGMMLVAREVLEYIVRRMEN